MGRSLKPGCLIQGQGLGHDYPSIVPSYPSKLEERERTLGDVPVLALSQPNTLIYVIGLVYTRPVRMIKSFEVCSTMSLRNRSGAHRTR
jgi:hypothetical protein